MERIVLSWNFDLKSTSKLTHDLPFKASDWNLLIKIPNRNEILYFSQDKCYFFDLSQLEVISQFISEFENLASNISNLLFSEDGSLLAIFSEELGRFCLIDLKERNILHYLLHPGDNLILLDVTAESITILEMDFILVFPWKAEVIDRQVNESGYLHLVEESNQLLRLYSKGCTFRDLKTKQISYAELDFFILGFCRCGPFFALALKDKILIGKFVKMNFEEVKSIPISNVSHMTSNGNQMLILCKTNQRATQIWRVYESSTWEIKSQFTTNYSMEKEYLKQVVLAKDSIIVNRGNTVSILNFQGEQISVLLNEFYGVIKGISPDFKFLLVCSLLESEVVELETRKSEMLKGSKWIFGHCWSENGKYLLILNEDTELQIWDWRTRTLKKSLKISFGILHSICDSKDFSETFVGSMNGSIWNFKIVGLETDKVDLELIWVHQPSFTATDANLKGTTISNENRSILEDYGAIKESSSELNDGKRKLTDDGDKNETDAKKRKTD